MACLQNSNRLKCRNIPYRILHYSCSVFSSKPLNSSWQTVLRSGQQLGFQSKEVEKLFSQQKNELDSLVTFYNKYPFVRKLLAEASNLNHPLKRFIFHLNYHEQRWKQYGVTSNLGSNKPRPHHGIFQRQENLFFLPTSLLLVGKVFYQEHTCSPVIDERKDALILENHEERLKHLTQAVQMLYLSQRFHETVRNNYQAEGSYQPKLDLASNTLLHRIQKEENDKGNRVATLVGDLFITEMFNKLAHVENNEVVQVISETLAEFSQENFLSRNDTEGLCLNDNNFDAVLSKEEQTYSASNFQNSAKAFELLFANSFYCCAILNGLADNKHLKLGSLFGKLYFSHCHALNLMDLLCCATEVQRSNSDKFTFVQSEKVMANLSQDFNEMFNTGVELRNLLTSIRADSKALQVFEAMITFLAFK